MKTFVNSDNFLSVKSIILTVAFFYGRYFDSSDRKHAVIELLNINYILRIKLTEQKILTPTSEGYKNEVSYDNKVNSAPKLILALCGINLSKVQTLNNGVAFPLHEKMAESLNAAVYFYELYKSCQKAGIENVNRQLRAKSPQETDIDRIKQVEIDKIVDLLNDSLMK